MPAQAGIQGLQLNAFVHSHLRSFVTTCFGRVETLRYRTGYKELKKLPSFLAG